MNSFTEFLEYFQTLALQHVDIKDFVHGPSVDIIAKSRSELKYPCLWLETPSTVVYDNNAKNTTADRICAFVVLENLPNALPAQRDALWQKLEEITFDLLSRMRKDKQARQFIFDMDGNGIPVEPISQLFVDNDYGWRVEFRINKFLPLCFNPLKWSSEIFDETFDGSYE
jgi:hypothetical protein